MNRLIVGVMMLMTVMMGCCRQGAGEAGKAGALIGRTEVKVTDGMLTPEALYSMARVGGVKISPDGTQALYVVTFTSIEQNKSNGELVVVRLDGSGKRQVTQTPQSEQQAVWLNEGREIAFLSSESGSRQMWVIKSDGTGRRQVSNVEGGMEGFVLSPDGKQVLYISNIKSAKVGGSLYAGLPSATGRIAEDLMYRHWDEWVESVPHPFVAGFDGEGLGEATDIMAGEPYECPMKPFNGVEDLAWSPDGKQVAYACRKKTGRDYALSTNSDIYIYTLATKETRNLTEGMMGYDVAPTFSPDGKYIAWISQERDGYESDKKRLFVGDLATGARRYLTAAFDYNADAIQWLPDSRSLYMIACKEAVTHIWQIDLEGRVRQITTGQYNYVGMDATTTSAADNKMVALRQSMETPSEVFVVNTQTGEATELSFENKAVIAQLAPIKSEPRWVKTTDGKRMLVWVVYPPNFDSNKKYPALLYCQGGPQSTVSQYWSYRWNFRIMAANGYIVVAPNRRGLPGFGQEWLEQISGDYGGQNMQDYFAAIDDVAKEPYVDAERLGAVGASYGGFSVYWLAGHHNKRFKAFVAHAGIFNLEQQYAETEEVWFANWDMGGPYWEKNNAVAKKTYATSPHRYVDQWDTPILITHGERDYRVPVSQGISAFNAAKLRGLPAEMLIFPDENHWILKPQNGVLFQRVFFDWLDRWLK